MAFCGVLNVTHLGTKAFRVVNIAESINLSKNGQKTKARQTITKETLENVPNVVRIYSVTAGVITWCAPIVLMSSATVAVLNIMVSSILVGEF